MERREGGRELPWSSKLQARRATSRKHGVRAGIPSHMHPSRNPRRRNHPPGRGRTLPTILTGTKGGREEEPCRSAGSGSVPDPALGGGAADPRRRRLAPNRGPGRRAGVPRGRGGIHLGVTASPAGGTCLSKLQARRAHGPPPGSTASGLGFRRRGFRRGMHVVTGSAAAAAEPSRNPPRFPPVFPSLPRPACLR